MPEQQKDINVIDLISSHGILPMFIHKDIKLMESILAICYEADLRAFEILNRTEDALDMFVQLKDYVESWLPGMKLCAGTVTDIQTAKKYIDAGASMIIAPNLDEEIGRLCCDSNVEWLPGISTVSDVYRALKIGTNSVKLFPAELSSPTFVSTIKSLNPSLRVVASGGIGVDHLSLARWFVANTDAVGIGNTLFSQMTERDINGQVTQKNIISTLQKIKHTRILASIK